MKKTYWTVLSAVVLLLISSFLFPKLNHKLYQILLFCLVIINISAIQISDYLRLTSEKRVLEYLVVTGFSLLLFILWLFAYKNQSKFTIPAGQIVYFMITYFILKVNLVVAIFPIKQ